MLHALPHTLPRRQRKAWRAAWLRRLLDLLYPPRCGLCRAAVGEAHTLCTPCFGKLGFLGETVCAACGHPLEYLIGEDSRCGECLLSPPPFAAARSALRYDDTSRPLVTRLKYGDQHHLLPLLSGWMAQAGEPLAAVSDALVPVPLHWRRRLKRRFNQSHLLSLRLGERYGLPVWPQALIRRRYTTPQVGLTRRQRETNVARAFAVPEAHRAQLSGKRILLIDDVLTSGATLEAATKALLKGGAESVRVLTLARRVLTGADEDAGNVTGDAA